MYNDSLRDLQGVAQKYLQYRTEWFQEYSPFAYQYARLHINGVQKGFWHRKNTV